MLRTQVIDDGPSFLGLKERWAELLRRSYQNHFYLTHPYLFTWWKHLAGDASLRIVLVTDGAELLAIAPLMHSRGKLARLPIRRVEPLGSGWGYGGIILSDKKPQCLEKIFDILDDMNDWGLIYLPHTVGDPSIGPREIVRPDRQRPLAHDVDPTRIPFISLDGSWEDYLAQRSTSFRRNIRNREKRMRRAGRTDFLRIGPASDTRIPHDQVMQWLRLIAERSWKADAGSAISSPRVFEFYSELAVRLNEEGQLDICFLFLDDRPVAYTFGAIYNHDYYEIDIAYDRELAKISPGTLLRNRLLQELFGQGLRRLDFVMDFDYKKELTSESAEFCTHFIFRKRPYPLLLRYIKRKVQPLLKSRRS